MAPSAQHRTALLTLAPLGLLLLLFVQRSSRSYAPPPAPPASGLLRETDEITSIAELHRLVRCPAASQQPLRLRWLPAAARAGGAAPGVPVVRPFILLHEAHVGESWLMHLLRWCRAVGVWGCGGVGMWGCVAAPRPWR